MIAGIVILFLLAIVVAVPLGLQAITGLGDPAADRGFAIVRRAALPSALLLALSFALPTGAVAAALAIPWLTTAGAGAALGLLAGARDPRRAQPGTRHAIWAALAFLAIGAGNAISDRLGIQPFGFSPTIVLLTAVHFHVAGFVLVIAGVFAYQRTGSFVAGAGVAAVIVGMPVTALGFFGVPIASLVGALFVSLGGIAIAVGTLWSATTFRSPWGRRLGWLAGISLLVAMPLASTYALGSALGTAWLDLPTMARTHGTLNVLGFALPAMVAWTLERHVRVEGRDLPASPADVIGFNIAPFVLAPIAGLLTVVVALQPLPLVLRVPLFLAGLAVVGLTVAACLTIWWVFGARAEDRWTWIAASARRPGRWLNLTTGFDDSTATLRHRLDGHGRVVDVFDPTSGHEPALLRARRRFPPPRPSVTANDLDRTIGSGSADTVFLLMAAHETHGPDRQTVFRSAARAMAPAGRIILVEHLRDTANRLAFGTGAGHFSTRANWLAAAGDAGLGLVEEARLTPFVAGFVFSRATR